MKTIMATICRESAESQIRAHRCNPARVALFSGRRHVLPIGDSDDWALYEDHGRVFCVAINRSLGYCGVQGYDHDDQEPDDSLSIFFQDSEQAVESIGDIDNLTDRTIARRLIGLLEEVTA